MSNPSAGKPGRFSRSRVVVRWAVRGLGVVLMLGVLFLGSNLLFHSAEPPPLFAAAALGPLPAEADNGHRDFVIGAVKLGAVPRAPEAVLELLDPSPDKPERAWEALLAQGDALSKEARDPQVAKWLDLLQRAYAKPRFADSCPMDPQATCGSLAVLKTHRLAEMDVLALAQAGDFAAALAGWANMERADADLVATSRSMLTYEIAMSCLDHATHVVRVVLVGQSQAAVTLDPAMRASLRDSISSALGLVTKEALDPTRMIRSEYLLDIRRIDLVTATNEPAPPDNRLSTGLFLPRTLFDRGGTIQLLNQRYERLTKPDQASAMPSMEAPNSDAPFWWLHNATGKRILDSMAVDFTARVKKASITRDRILSSKEAALTKARELAP